MKFKKLYIFLLFLLPAAGCNDVLDLEALDKITQEDLFGDPEGTKLYMANLYRQLPIEDFTFFHQGFNQNGPGPNNGGLAQAMRTDHAHPPDFGHFLGH